MNLDRIEKDMERALAIGANMINKILKITCILALVFSLLVISGVGVIVAGIYLVI